MSGRRPLSGAADAVRGLPPWAVAALTLGLASLFVVARWWLAADGDVARFVVAGTLLTSPEAGVPRLPGPGYDGQFSYRLALDPTDLRLEAQGIALDSALRLQRITYPALVFVVALGQTAWVPTALVLVNLLGLAAIAFLGAHLARDLGRAPICGLLLAGFFGFVVSLGRDLTEITTAATLLGGVLAWQRGRHALAALSFSAAVLSRESALLFVGAYLLAELAAAWRGGRLRVRPVLLASLPLAAFGAWQVICWRVVGVLPLRASEGRNLVLPGQDLAPAVLEWMRGAAALDRQDLINLGQFGYLLVVVLMAVWVLKASTTSWGVKAAWGVALLLVLSLSESVWRGPADFRTAVELHLASALVLLGSRRSLLLPGTLLLVATPLTALLRIVDV